MITWKSDKLFTIGNINFLRVDLDAKRQTDATEFVINKHRWMIERYEKMLEQLKPTTIFELGIRHGGSCLFFFLVAQPEKLVTIDISDERVDSLDTYIENNHLETRIKPFYNTDQSDIHQLRSIAKREFSDKPIDLVIDDASHFLDETRQSFNALFPLVRPGGAYVIEDWPWAHASIESPDDTPGFFPDRPPMTKLIFEIVLACPSTKGLIERIEIDRNSAIVWRGNQEIDAETFDIENCFLARGRSLIC